jgi:hypothetical protein
MSHPKREREPSVDFDFDEVLNALDGAELADLDEEFWRLSGEFFAEPSGSLCAKPMAH